jgi:hypothetical protein
MSKDEDLRELLNGTAQDISRLQDSPRTWLTWMVFLLARLEEEATNQNPGDKDSYVAMLDALQDEIRNRLKTGGWN